MKIFTWALFFTFLASTNVCLAYDVTLNGETTDGWRISIYAGTPAEPFSIRAWKKGDEKSIQSFKKESCEFSEGDFLMCPSNTKSPLAGTKYIGHINNEGSCEDGDPEYIYICVSGCDQNKRAPRKLYQPHYEC